MNANADVLTNHWTNNQEVNNRQCKHDNDLMERYARNLEDAIHSKIQYTKKPLLSRGESNLVKPCWINKVTDD